MRLLNGQRNCSGVDMRRLDLSEIGFRGASLYCARLGGAPLRYSMLSGGETTLAHVSSVGADQTSASLAQALATTAVFDGAVMIEVMMEEVQAKGASFSEAKMPNAVLTSRVRPSRAAALTAPR